MEMQQILSTNKSQIITIFKTQKRSKVKTKQTRLESRDQRVEATYKDKDQNPKKTAVMS